MADTLLNQWWIQVQNIWLHIQNVENVSVNYVVRQ